MSVYEMQGNYEAFPEMKNIYNSFINGDHIVKSSKRNGNLYAAISKNEDNFFAYYKDIGFDMVHHEDGSFYYLDKLDSLKRNNGSSNTKYITVFIAILLMEVSPDFFIGREMFNKEFIIDNLPHFKVKNLEEKAIAAGIQKKNIPEILKKMEKRSIISFNERGNGFNFNEPLLRFVDDFNRLYEESNMENIASNEEVENNE